MKIFKSLFITHDAGNYGASRSLQLLLRHFDQARVDLVVPKTYTQKNDLNAVKIKFGRNIENVKDFFLPFDFCYKGRPEWRLPHLFQKPLVNASWRLNRKSLYRYIEAGNYDFIHLNSLVLHEIISEKYNFIIHLREIFDGSNSEVHESLAKAKGIIFIDEDTRAPFAGRNIPSRIVLNNPFDMTPLDACTLEKLGPRYSDLADCTVFSMLGRITEIKGVDFIIRCFKEVSAEEARLLIVGKGDRHYMNKCRDIAGTDHRIIFWGEETDIFGIYRISDYILRGEAFRCIGRTIYEGLYSGCGAIVPDEQTDGSHMFEYETFKNSVFFYPPGDQGKLVSLLKDLSKYKVKDKVYRSNVPEYVTAFSGFVSGVLGPR